MTGSKIKKLLGRFTLCIFIALCCYLLVFGIYLLAGRAVPQMTDYSGAAVDYDADDLLTELGDTVDIALGEKMFVEARGVSVIDGNIVIRAAGAYRLSGELENGSIYIAADGGAVHILLDNADISCDDAPAVYISAADKVIFTTAENSRNRILTTVKGGLESAIYSDADITFNGSGELDIQSENGIAINCGSNVRFFGGSYNITAKENAVKAAYSVSVREGDIKLESGADGVKTTASGKSGGRWVGVVDISGGKLNIVSEKDGISSSSIIAMSGGEVSLFCGGGSNEKSSHSGFGGFGRDEKSNKSDKSAKGLKAETGIYITGGTLKADCADDAVHSDGDVTIAGGFLTLLSDGDGIQGDKSVFVTGGEISAERCYEGICGSYIALSSGNISITASDDGISASNSSNPIAKLGKSIETDLLGTGGRLVISGGNIKITASGDAIDSNGSITQTGGSVYVGSISTGPDVAIDYDGDYSMSGGELAAFGNGGAMMQTISADKSSSYAVTIGADIRSGSVVRVVDEAGAEIVSLVSEYDCQSLVLASDSFEKDMSLTALVDEAEIGTVILSENTVSVGDTGKSMGGGMPMGGRPDFGSGEQPPDMENGGRGDGKDFGGERPDFGSGEQPPDMENVGRGDGKGFGGERPDFSSGEQPSDMENGGRGDGKGFGGEMPQLPTEFNAEMPQHGAGHGGGAPQMRDAASVLLPAVVSAAAVVAIGVTFSAVKLYGFFKKRKRGGDENDIQK